MTSKVGWSITLLGVIAVIVAVAIKVSAQRWRRATSAVVARLDAARAPSPSQIDAPAELAELPPVVARYFVFALPPEQRRILRARLEQTGEFSMNEGKSWKPFDAVEHFQVHRPGFVWEAAIHMAPAVDVVVRDSYVAGEGSTQGRMVGLLSVVDLHGTPEMARGSLQRYLAEAVWIPTALLPSSGVAWSPIDDRSARATIMDGAVTASFDFRFGEHGEITGGSTMRHREVDGRLVFTPWDAHFGDYARIDGMMIPRRGEVAWVLPVGRSPYWRGRIQRADYERAAYERAAVPIP
jgi:hypothetical protein